MNKISVQMEQLPKENYLDTQNREVISIIGTGNYGIALGKRLIQFGFNVAYGSRKINFEYVRKCLEVKKEEEHCFNVYSIEEAFYRADKFIFFAVKGEESVYSDIVDKLFSEFDKKRKLEETVINKVVIEISNRNEKIKSNSLSNAEILQSLFDKQNKSGSIKVSVVKGFTSISAYTMGLDIKELRGPINSTPICSNNLEAREKTIKLCCRMGFQGFEFGTLVNAGKLEKINEGTFESWLYPSIFSLVFFIFNAIWIFVYSPFVGSVHKTGWGEYLRTYSILGQFVRASGFSALNLLSYVYIPSTLASCFQLYYGTKYIRFPKFLDSWLKSRKQIGLWALLFATVHMIAAFPFMSPGYKGESWYRPIEKIENKTVFDSPFEITMFKFIVEGNILAGTVAYIILLIVGITSINSVALSLNWKEWRFVQTKLGLLAIVMGVLHDGLIYLRFVIEREYYNYDAAYLLTRVFLFVLIVPFFTVLMRIFFAYFPPIKNRLYKING